MSYSEEDARQDEHFHRLYNEFGPQWADEHAEELYRRHYDEAVKEFTAERLKSFYVAHPNLAQPALRSLGYAQSLVSSHPAAALVFATTAIELAIKVVLLQPIIYGLVHIEAFAPLVADQCTQQTGAKRFHALLFEILDRFGGVNLREFRRHDSEKTLWQEFTSVQDARNAVVHGFSPVDLSTADLAITIAVTLLSVVFPQVLARLDLHLHDPGGVCAKMHGVTISAYFPIPDRAPSIIGPVILDLEKLDLDRMPPTISGRLGAKFSDEDAQQLRSVGRRVPMWITSTLVQYELSFHSDSNQFTGTLASEPPEIKGS